MMESVNRSVYTQSELSPFSYYSFPIQPLYHLSFFSHTHPLFSVSHSLLTCRVSSNLLSPYLLSIYEYKLQINNY